MVRRTRTWSRNLKLNTGWGKTVAFYGLHQPVLITAERREHPAESSCIQVDWLALTPHTRSKDSFRISVYKVGWGVIQYFAPSSISDFEPPLPGIYDSLAHPGQGQPWPRPSLSSVASSIPSWQYSFIWWDRMGVIDHSLLQVNASGTFIVNKNTNINYNTIGGYDAVCLIDTHLNWLLWERVVWKIPHISREPIFDSRGFLIIKSNLVSVTCHFIMSILDPWQLELTVMPAA